MNDKYIETAKEMDVVDQWINPKERTNRSKPSVPRQLYRELETELRQALDAGDHEAVGDIKRQMYEFNITTEDLPPDLQAQMPEIDILEHPDLRHVLTPPDDYEEET